LSRPHPFKTELASRNIRLLEEYPILGALYLHEGGIYSLLPYHFICRFLFSLSRSRARISRSSFGSRKNESTSWHFTSSTTQSQ
ncbi:unnamed protein product, partial [Musa acuminata subsp. burmannicoides]